MDERPKILIVDDEPLNLDYLEQELEDRDLEILTAANGQEALEAVAAHDPDLVFLDIMMPVLDGFEVLRRLKADPRWNGTPVVIISAADDLPSVVKGIELGAEDFLPKPFNPVLLHARLNAGLEKKRLRDIERRYLRALERELEIGREIQAGFLPQVIPQPPGWEIAAFFRPAREVAGDFYDVFELEGGRLALLVGDVTDKGVGPALYMALYRSLLRAVMQLASFTEHASAGATMPTEARLLQAVTLVNNYICRIHDSGMFATLFFGVLDLTSGDLEYINGGHDPPIVMRGDSAGEALAQTGPLVGALEGAQYQVRSVRLERGDGLVLYSDGVTDAQSPDGELFGSERWHSQLQRAPAPGEKRFEQLAGALLAFIGDEPLYDDISLVVVGRL